MSASYQETWDKVVALKSAGAAEAKGVTNTLSREDIITIVATIDFFGGDYVQDLADLKAYRYRVFDWLGMRVMSGRDEVATKVLVYSFLKSGGVPSKFVQDLRESDYDVDDSWIKVKL